MATRDTAARRYAEAAFQVAVRDDTVAAWRAELDVAGEIAADEEVGRMLANPAAPLESREEMAQSIFGKVVSKPVLNMIQLLLRRGRIHQLPTVAAEFRRLDNARTRSGRSPRGSNNSAAVASSSTSRSIPACWAA